jgi:hypothetical protein
MQYVIHIDTHCLAGVKGTYIGFNKSKPAPLLRTDEGLHLVEVHSLAGHEVVYPYNPLIEPEEFLQQVRADKSGDPRDQPGFGGRLKAFLDL